MTILRKWRRALAAGLSLVGLSLSTAVHADVSSVGVDSTAWVAVLAQGQNALVQAYGAPMVLATSNLAPTTGPGATSGVELQPGAPPLCLSPSPNGLWAIAEYGRGTVKIVTGTGCNAAGGGNSGGTAQTANQGTAGNSPWPVNDAQYNSTLPTFANGSAGYFSVDVNGRLLLSPSSVIGVTQSGPWTVILPSTGPVTPGTRAGNSDLVAGTYNTALPALTNGQQAAFQLDPSGRLYTLPFNIFGSPTDGATTQQSLTGLSVIGSRAAEPSGLGEWYVQNQCTSVMYAAFYTGTAAVTSAATARLATIAVDPGAGLGRQGGDQSWQTSFGAFQGPMTLWGTSGCQATFARQ